MKNTLNNLLESTQSLQPRALKKTSGIRRKILAGTLLLVLSAIFISFIISFASLSRMVRHTEDIFEKTEEISVSGSSDMLIDLTSSQAAESTKNCAQTVNAKISNMFNVLSRLSDSIADIYEHPDDYQERPYRHPSRSPAGEYCMQWVLPENVEMEGDIEHETYLLGNMKRPFHKTLERNENILSIYYTSATGLNIGYDDTPQTKPMYYEGRNAGWYTTARDSGSIYLSDVYEDSFGRGKMVTLAIPCVAQDGRFFGVCGMDILIEDLAQIILDVDTHEDSYAMMASSTGVICVADGSADDADKVLGYFVDDGKTLLDAMKENGSGIKRVTYGDKELYCAFHSVEYSDWMIVIVIPKDTIIRPSLELKELYGKTTSAAIADEHSMVNSSFVLWLVSLLIIALAAILTAFTLAGNISSPIIELSKSVERVGTGDLEYKCDIRTGDEIEGLSKSFESMTVSLKEYIENYTKVTAEKQRIGAELDVATHIQSSMLPSIFPHFSDRPEFEIYATMDPAKEVGGDFYDFFMVDERHLAVVMADVSGKGVPAALFMVIGKTLIKDHTSPDTDLGSVFTEVNSILCESNSEGLFITAFEGVLDLVTGEFRFVNAGHEMPFICRAGGRFEPYKVRAGFVLAGMEGMRYKSGSFTLSPGDKIFLYTDGVTEATDAYNNLYGMGRLETALNELSELSPGEILPGMKENIDAFVGEAPQFDDITMLCLLYKRPLALEDDEEVVIMNEITLPATTDNISTATGFMNEILDSVGCSKKVKHQLDIALDELMSNVARYAYKPNVGDVTISVKIFVDPDRAVITLRDSGKPYNPLRKEDPDVTLPAEDREIGGLGIYIVKESMDDMSYEYKNRQNIVTVVKNLD